MTNEQNDPLIRISNVNKFFGDFKNFFHKKCQFEPKWHKMSKMTIFFIKIDKNFYFEHKRAETS